MVYRESGEKGQQASAAVRIVEVGVGDRVGEVGQFEEIPVADVHVLIIGVGEGFVAAITDKTDDFGRGVRDTQVVREWGDAGVAEDVAVRERVRSDETETETETETDRATRRRRRLSRLLRVQPRRAVRVLRRAFSGVPLRAGRRVGCE